VKNPPPLLLSVLIRVWQDFRHAESLECLESSFGFGDLLFGNFHGRDRAQALRSFMKRLIGNRAFLAISERSSAGTTSGDFSGAFVIPRSTAH
jgi:hypothetical protein